MLVVALGGVSLGGSRHSGAERFDGAEAFLDGGGVFDEDGEEGHAGAHEADVVFDGAGCVRLD